MADSCELIMPVEGYRIIGAAMEVSSKLGCGFLEAVYQEALGIEMTRCGIPHQQQKRMKIQYKGQPLSQVYIADFLCFDNIIVEIKAIKIITLVEEAQTLNYLKATNLQLGFILNFGLPRLQWQRIVNTR